MKGLSEKELGIAMLSLYHMWLARNDARELPMIENPESTANRIMALWEEWEAIKAPVLGSRAKVVEHWCSPAEGWLKVNCDGSFILGDGPGAGEWSSTITMVSSTQERAILSLLHRTPRGRRC
jgi:hypothetical protein